MHVTVELVGERTVEVTVEDGQYGDLLAPLELSQHEVSILVDGRPVPEDAPIDDGVDSVRVVRLVSGG
ncbi:MAG: ubiquitin-like small modifier protein 2 [Halovenus sp.]